jgi:heptosyltransferase-2
MPRRLRSILVITKHNFIGDTIVATPLLRAVRGAFPEAKTVVLTGASAADVLKECPYVDRVHTYDPRGSQRGLFATVGVVRELRRAHGGAPDACLIVDRSVRAALLALLCGAPVRAGFDTEGRGSLLTHRVPYINDRRETECCLDTLRAIAPEGRDDPRYEADPILFVTASERERAARLLRENCPAAMALCDGAAPVRFVGIQPGASYARKQWTALGFAELARALAADGIIPVMLGGKQEVPTARAVRAAIGADVPCVDLTGLTTLRETMGLLTHLAAFVGNDTGVSHMAASLGTATVQLFGPTLDVKWGQRSPRNQVLIAPNRDLECLDAAPVIAAVRALLADRTDRDAAFPVVPAGVPRDMPLAVGATR